MLKHFASGMLIVLAPLSALASEISVAPDISKFNLPAGEAQSTIVAPGKNGACPSGRILVSSDFVRPPITKGSSQSGIVSWRNLGPSGAEGTSVHDAPPHAKQYLYGSNDHNLVALPNGDVIYSIAGFSKRELTPKPAWFDYTFRGTFGPGARSVMMTWRSTDCGGHFSFVSEVDSATLSGGQCGNPQAFKGTPPPPQKFDMGGTDGPWLGVDPNSGALMMTHGCFGNLPASPTGVWALGAGLNRTVVLRSIDEGSNWTELGQTPPSLWGSHIVMQPAPGPLLAVGVGTGLVIGRALNPNAYAFPQAVTVNALWGWPQNTGPTNLIFANIWASSIITRVPGSRAFLLAFPYEWPKPPPANYGNGYRLFLYDPSKSSNFDELPPILAQAGNQSAVTMHLTPVDPGQGPLLLYWNDVDGANKTAIIRGRVLYGYGQMSDDFAIRRIAGIATNFSIVTGGGAYWYGDYNSAGAYAATGGVESNTYHYYPMWIEPDQTVRYTEVTVSVPKLFALAPVALHATPALSVTPHLQPAELLQIEEHERTRGAPQGIGPVLRVTPIQQIRPIRRPAPDASDGSTNTGTPSTAAPSARGPATRAVITSRRCKFTDGPRTGQIQDYALMAPLPVGSQCQDARGSAGVVVP